MAASQSPRAAPRKSRKSLAHVPTSIASRKENVSPVASAKAASRKTRSQSIGPGGLEALGEITGNRQKVLPIPRSILKPSIPLSPPKPIPPHPSSRRDSPSKTKPGPSPGRPASGTTPGQSGLSNVPDPFGSGSPKKEAAGKENQATVGLKSEEQQQAAAREKERKEALERRDARRKSLANRRVSFAPEATLHTWDVVELPEDATSSSEATNSTGRASAASSLPTSPYPQGEPHDPASDPEPPSTPPEEEIQVAASPANQRDEHKKRRRRSSAIPPMTFDDSEDTPPSPTSSFGSDDTHQSIATEGSVIDGSDSDEDRDLVAREETVTGVDNDDITSHSSGSHSSVRPSSTNSSGQLDEALRQATLQAGNQDVMLDADGDVSMEMADREVTNAFQPWARQAPSGPPNPANQTSLLDQDDVDPFLYNASIERRPGSTEEELTMDMTQAVGGILPREQPAQASPTRGRRKSVSAAGRRASAGRRRSSGGSSAMADETMELTTASGGIKQSEEEAVNDVPESVDGDEDMSMELTKVIGPGIRAFNNSNSRRESASPINDDEMDMTAPIGRVLSPVTERTEPTDEETMGMDITVAMGAILPDGLKTDDRRTAKLLMEEEADHGQLTHSPFAKDKPKAPEAHEEQVTEASPQPASTLETPSKASGGGSLSIVRQSPRTRASPRLNTPIKKPSTPSRQVTPQAERPSTPNKTPLNKNVAMRKTSPKRLFKPEGKSPAAKSPKQTPNKLEFKNDEATGATVPSIVLTPSQRRSSGVGIDQPGLGSPKIAEKLDRRASIGETASEFTPLKSGGVRFEDPRMLEKELEKERAEEQRRESGRGILQMEADAAQPEKDATTSLRDMIQSLTPKKAKMRGRKSLHVGAAKGILGKRPIELDQDDEDATPKKLRGIEKSPVKSIRLPAPPSKEETTGRLNKATRASLAEIDGNASTPTTHTTPNAKATTPRDQGRYKDTGIMKSAEKAPVSFNEQLTGVPADNEPQEDDRIHLSDFLNMTSIRFMELTTTKRRHTVAPNQGPLSKDALAQAGQGAETGNHLADCVAAGACTVPMLELYQHSCRELKRYIAEGRDIVKDIEADTYEDNPPLFREYLSAAPDLRALMDNQFKNVKTHARLLSRAMWYEWRSKLLDGLREGLLRIEADLAADDEKLKRQEALLEPVVPGLVARHEELEAIARALETQVEELANCDQEELQAARERLVALDEELEAKRALLEEAREQMTTTEERLEMVVERGAECQAETQEAERVREEYRGWSGAEVAELQASVDAITSTHGWAITSASGPELTLTFRSALSLTLDPSHFQPHAPESLPNGPISLVRDAPPPSSHPDDTTATTLRFFLQLLRARLLALPQSRVPLRSALAVVAAGHALSTRVRAQADALADACFPTEARIVGDSALEIVARVLLRAVRTVVEVRFEIQVGEGPQSTAEGQGAGELAARVTVAAKVVYGEELKEGRMGEFLDDKIGGKVEGWADAVRELEARLIARGRKLATA